MARFAQPLEETGDRFGMRALPDKPPMTEWLFMEMGMDGTRSLRVAVVLDAALHDFDSKRNGARQSLLSLLGARSKQARFPHPRIRR